jgi:2',3'-cyclic-nucleotide 2'-phosphodiesterase (5'-nucleotidase family)
MEYVKGLTFTAPEAAVPPLIKEVKQKGARLVVLLTHLGLDRDKKLAAAVPGIDVIVGGHSHTVVTDPVVVGRTIIVQAGYYGLYLGVLELAVDEKTGRIVEATKTSELKPVSAGPDAKPDPDIARIVDTYDQRVRGRFAQVVGETTVDLVRRADGESNIGDVISDAVRAATGAEIAFHNSGGIRADIPAGKVNMEQIYTVLPFDNVVLAMDLKGEDILALLERSAGLAKGMLQVSGVTFRCDLTKLAGTRVSKVTVGKAPLDRLRTYRVATNDFLSAGGDRFTEFRKGTNIVFGGALRDVFVDYLRQRSPIAPTPEGRITVTGR